MIAGLKTKLIAVTLLMQTSKAKLTAFNTTIIAENHDLLVNCISNIIVANFIHKPTILLSGNSDDTSNAFYVRLTNRLVNDFVPRIIVDEIINTDPIFMQDDHWLFIKYFHHCENMFNVQSETIDERKRYLIILLHFSESCVEMFGEHGKNMSKYDITYVTKIRTKDDYHILTFIPQIDANTCTVQYDLPATILSTCSSKIKFNAFPSKKPQDLMKCPFKVGMASLFPFTKITNKTSLVSLDPLYENEGSDFEVLKIMAKYLNVTLDFRYIYRSEENPYLVTDFLNFLLNGSLDACAGGLYRIFGDIVDYSGVYGRQSVMWMYPVNRASRSWQNLVTKVNGLYVFMIFYACYSVIWYLFSTYDNQAISISKLMLYTWGALVGTSSLLNAISLKQKILNVVYLVMCIHLSAYISTQMYSFLTIVGPPTVYKTNSELINSGFKPYLKTLTKYFINDKSYEAFANTSEECDSFLDCENMCMKYNGVTVLIDSLFTQLQADTAVNDEARTLRVTENVLTVYHEMLLRKGGSVNKKFQKAMLRLSEAGILDRLYAEAIGILTSAKAEIATKKMLSYSYSCEQGCSITLEQTGGAFYLWFIGCGVSICVFIVEIMVEREIRSTRNTEQLIAPA